MKIRVLSSGESYVFYKLSKFQKYIVVVFFDRVCSSYLRYLRFHSKFITWRPTWGTKPSRKFEEFAKRSDKYGYRKTSERSDEKYRAY